MEQLNEEKLIGLYEANELLWNHKHPDHFNRKKVANALANICVEMGPSHAADDLKKKWRSLRTAFAREVRQEKTKRSGQSAEDVYVSRWKHFKAMQFLRTSMQVDASISNLQAEQEKEVEKVASDIDVEDVASPPKKTKGSREAERKEKLLQAAEKVLCGVDEEDEELLFAKQIACSLKKFDIYTRARIKLEIQSVIVKHMQPQQHSSSYFNHPNHYFHDDQNNMQTYQTL